MTRLLDLFCGEGGAAIGQRFWSKVDRRGDDGCWIWIAGRRDGYGIFAVPGIHSPQRAHRVSYILLVGPIPDGLQLDHLCRNRACVNPRHLEPVVQRENLRRSPLVAFAVNAAKTHCPHGHPYSSDNTRIYRGRRFCRRCQAIARDRARGKL